MQTPEEWALACEIVPDKITEEAEGRAFRQARTLVKLLVEESVPFFYSPEPVGCHAIWLPEGPDTDRQSQIVARLALRSVAINATIDREPACPTFSMIVRDAPPYVPGIPTGTPLSVDAQWDDGKARVTAVSTLDGKPVEIKPGDLPFLEQRITKILTGE